MPRLRVSLAWASFCPSVVSVAARKECGAVELAGQMLENELVVMVFQNRLHRAV
jgi:hypothetical protein